MQNSFTFKSDRPWPNPYLAHAAIVGHTNDTSVRLWFRTDAPGDFSVLIYAAQADATEEVSAGFKSSTFTLAALPAYVRHIPFNVPDISTDTTTIVDIDQLTPGTEYRYALYGSEGGVSRILLGQDRAYRFSTMPAKPGSFSFGFFSCHMPYKQSIFGGTNVVNTEMWQCLNEVMDRHYEKDFRFLIGGGDQVYADGVTTLDIWKYLNAVMSKEAGELSPGMDEMLSWYRDIHRGYWGFPAVRTAFSRYPTYMIWDDHELGDGWGSYLLDGGKNDELDEIFPKRKEKKMSREDCLELLSRMKQAATQVYREYQHSHNPSTPDGQFDYSFEHGKAVVYVLDGRGHRDINRRSRRILGAAQFSRFSAWLNALNPKTTPYLFVVSAVPMLHLKSVTVNADDNALADLADLQDDLRDAWEHKLHDAERKALLSELFAAAARGIRICILSGDVHTSAAFRMIDDKTKAVMYQLTSSAITYNQPRALGWVLGNLVEEEGQSGDGYHFERLALYVDSNFSVVRVDTEADRVEFRLYGLQQVSHPDGTAADRPMTHAIAKLELRF